MNKQIKTVTIIIVIILIISGTYLILINKSSKIKNTNNTNNSKEEASQDLKNSFSIKIPEGWVVSSTLKDATNTVKFGSPVQVTDLKLTTEKEEIYSPTIILMTFVIDEKLTVKEVVNLINDEKLADKISGGTNKCYSQAQTFTVSEMNAYSYVFDNTSQETCNEGSETVVSKTVVLKNPGNQNTLMLTLVARDNNEFNTLLPDFQRVVDSIEYQNQNTNINTSSTNDSVKEYSNPAFRYSLEYHSAWNLDSTQASSNGYLKVSSLSSAFLEVYVLEKSVNQSLTNWLAERDKNSDGQTLTQEYVSVGTLNGQKRTVATMGDANDPSTDIYLDDGDRVYELAGKAEAANQAEFDQIINSFQVL